MDGMQKSGRHRPGTKKLVEFREIRSVIGAPYQKYDCRRTD
jgi:hypothetical protein